MYKRGLTYKRLNVVWTNGHWESAKYWTFMVKGLVAVFDFISGLWIS